ncbi:hypothetical protein BC940DRAFT_359198 [Gongronella butleri]|nr:hypothetical protein BC940DRAFT_359198 [Gongronella butleri]
MRKSANKAQDPNCIGARLCFFFCVFSFLFSFFFCPPVFFPRHRLPPRKSMVNLSKFSLHGSSSGVSKKADQAREPDLEQLTLAIQHIAGQLDKMLQQQQQQQKNSEWEGGGSGLSPSGCSTPSLSCTRSCATHLSSGVALADLSTTCSLSSFHLPPRPCTHHHHTHPSQQQHHHPGAYGYAPSCHAAPMPPPHHPHHPQHAPHPTPAPSIHGVPPQHRPLHASASVHNDHRPATRLGAMQARSTSTTTRTTADHASETTTTTLRTSLGRLTSLSSAKDAKKKRQKAAEAKKNDPLPPIPSPAVPTAPGEPLVPAEPSVPSSEPWSAAAADMHHPYYYCYGPAPLTQPLLACTDQYRQELLATPNALMSPPPLKPETTTTRPLRRWWKNLRPKKTAAIVPQG